MRALNGTDLAPEGHIYVCAACGKTSKSRYGFDDHDRSVASHGWDESCMLNCALFREADVVRDERGRIVKVGDPVPFEGVSDSAEQGR